MFETEKKEKEKKSKVPHQSTITATVLAQYKHTECTMPKYYRGHWRFLYIRNLLTFKYWRFDMAGWLN